MGAEESRPQTANVQAPRSPSERFLSDPMKSLGLVYYPEGDDEEDIDIDKVADGLYIGSIEGAAEKSLLDRNGITHILNAENYQTHPQAFRPKAFVYMLTDIPRDKTVNLRQYLPRTNKFIRDARRDGCNVLVHCRDGVSTSATLVLGYLVSEGMSLSAARARLDTVRPGINVSKPYLQQLDDFFREVSKGGTIPTSVTPPARSPGSNNLQQRYEGYDTGQSREKSLIPSNLYNNEGSTFWQEQTAQPEYRTKVEEGWENWTEQDYWKRQRNDGGLGTSANDSFEDESERWDDYSYW
eukprot:CAMPEP_0177716886 /NCGR_PEP_ID=MMETSP0484_2-20121128/14739_1 /TAXON_ID=354590 /ORGANISM="Rhodomonas lens, Strain RHODO" /LENGTH=296 /DNA_ID=CAMNT_0019228927 /DNA_START=65 /DNA_END=952 /DNA_ORIENTATION=+